MTNGSGSGEGLFDFVGMKFRGLTTLDMLVETYSWIFNYMQYYLSE